MGKEDNHTANPLEQMERSGGEGIGTLNNGIDFLAIFALITLSFIVLQTKMGDLPKIEFLRCAPLENVQNVQTSRLEMGGGIEGTGNENLGFVAHVDGFVQVRNGHKSKLNLLNI